MVRMSSPPNGKTDPVVLLTLSPAVHELKPLDDLCISLRYRMVFFEPVAYGLEV